MEPFSIEELSDRVGGRFPLVVAAAKRARQLKEGAVPLVKISSNNPLTVALAEIAAGRVVVKLPGEPGDEPEIRPGAKREEPRLSDEDLLGGDLFGIALDDEIGEDLEDDEPEPDEDEMFDEEEPEFEL
ncbi:MAG: DNA-directed RNA polymerase subunit omega [candidate division WS1 bacterium]|nr:DNA-directed RNA polymerase subunit omega [candidate division WS1 bacterium]